MKRSKQRPNRRKKKGRRRASGCNLHHILFQGQYWHNGYANLLREHPYLKKEIPAGTLHVWIHSRIHDVPRPNGDDCKRAYNELRRREQCGLIDLKHDTLEQRIDFLIEMWQDTCPATVAVLTWQRDIAAKFYAGRKRWKRRNLQ